MPRFSIDFQGVTYLRRRSKWLSSNLGIPQIVASQLDALVNGDPSLARQVREQDRLDIEPVQSLSSSRPRSVSRQSPSIDYRFIEDASVVIVTADLAKGWRPFRKGSGFYGRIVLAELRPEVYVRVAVFRRSMGKSSHPLPEFPEESGSLRGSGLIEFTDLETGNLIELSDEELQRSGFVRHSQSRDSYTEKSAIHYKIAGHRLEAKIDLRTENGQINPALHLTARRSGGANVLRVFDVCDLEGGWHQCQLGVTVCAPRPLPAKTEWQNVERGFVAGGRPGSSRLH